MNDYVRRLALALGLCGIFSGAQAQVVVSQVYGGGGNSGATLKSDFIELRNNGASAVSLAGWSVQYASATGNTWQRTNLAGSIPAGGYYLIKQATGAGGTVDLPAADATGTIAMAATAGKVALVGTTTTLSGACPLAAALDFVGFGSTANCFEGSGPTATMGNSSAALRAGDGATDSNNNNADFSVGAPNPRNSSNLPPPPPQPAVALSIAQIQGSGLLSAHAGVKVVTEGIVTARKFNSGFFLQSANYDGDAATSDGIFVFTGSAPPAAAVVGARVRVTAKVIEFTPSSNPNQLSITELIEPVVVVLETGATLPSTVELTAADLGPGATPATLERLEGMRVSVAHARAIAASGGSIDENDALASTDGVFHVVLPEVARPFREAGIGVLDALPIPAGKHPPRFDTNPERLMVRSRGQIGAAALALDVDADVDGLAGVLDYFSGTWALLPDPAATITVVGGKLPKAVNDAAYEDVTIGGFNLLRLFDEIADGNGAVTLTAAALDKRLGKTAAAICDYLKAPDILGVVEVENTRVLQLLADRIDAACPRAPAYVPYLIPGNDIGGINVGFLVSTRNAGTQPRVEVLDVVQYGKLATLANPDGSTSLLNDRPSLLLRARVHQDNGVSYPVTVIVNHLRSLSGIDEIAPASGGWSSESARVRAKRAAQAAYLAAVIESLQQGNPGERIVLVGDFNAFEFNDGYVDVMGIVRGDEAAEDQVLNYIDSPITTPLVDGSQLIADPAHRYSFAFAGNAQSIDHVVVNEALLLDALGVRVEHARINADFGVHHFGNHGLPLRVSDHDPVRVAITVPSFRSADLGVIAAAAPPTLRVGDTATFTAGVTNAGPNAADHASAAFVFDALLAPAITAPSGWTCSLPLQDAATTTVTCTTPSLANGATATFRLQVVAGDALGGRSLQFAVAVASTITDPANGDNAASASVDVLADADLALALAGPSQPFRSGTTADFPLTLRNAGPDAAWQPRVSLRGDAPASAVAIAAPAGWQCGVAGLGAGFEATCAFAGAFPAGAQQVFEFAITAPPRDGKDSLTLTAAVAAATPDPVAGNDSAGIVIAIVGAPKDTPAPSRPAPTPPGR